MHVKDARVSDNPDVPALEYQLEVMSDILGSEIVVIKVNAGCAFEAFCFTQQLMTRHSVYNYTNLERKL